ncbi:tail fiber domain-containing protein [uncultured Flavobacterium sp.]|uniref:tail fiber domain-containing protein n=1 Tax=uncultured Flavobacterium sp. TaxID=165435 RepID=UPI0030C8487D
MKTKLLIFSLFAFGISFAQNKSSGSVQSVISSPTAVAGEIFRFQPGNVKQLDAGSSFTTNNSRWFSMGNVAAGSITSYGLRFQLPSKSVFFGYQDITSANPRIEWFGESANLGDLEFRVGNNFASSSTTLAATMTKFGNTVFGTTNPFGNNSASPRVGIVSSGNSTALSIISDLTAIDVISTGGAGVSVDVSGSTTNYGGLFNAYGGEYGIGIYAQAQGVIQSTGVNSYSTSAENNIGVRGTTLGQGGFEAGIYGDTPTTGNYFAGYFDGDVFTTASYLPSDAKLKDNVVNEENVLKRLEKLRPVTYEYKDIKEMHLPMQKQHGFISQELAAVFPELTKDVTKPIFDEKGKIVSSFEFKSINYNGLISVLTAGMLELNKEVKALKEELAEYKSNEILRNRLNESSNTHIKGYSMEQNVPNPFTDQTQIRFQLPTNVSKANIVVFDLNGRLIKEYDLNQNSGLLNIQSSDLGKGMFLYTMVYNGSEIMTKKMIVR